MRKADFRGKFAWAALALAPVMIAAMAAAQVPAPTPAPVPNTGYAIGLSVSSTTAATGQPVSLSGTANRDIGPTPYGLSIIDTTTGQEVAHVGSGSVISAAVRQLGPSAPLHCSVITSKPQP